MVVAVVVGVVVVGVVVVVVVVVCVLCTHFLAPAISLRDTPLRVRGPE